MTNIVGDDGLTDREREAAYYRWQEGPARRPTVEELQALHQVLAEHAGERMCRRCGHPERAHQRYTASDHCAWCACRSWRSPRPRWWPGWAR